MPAFGCPLHRDFHWKDDLIFPVKDLYQWASASVLSACLAHYNCHRPIIVQTSGCCQPKNELPEIKKSALCKIFSQRGRFESLPFRV